MATIRDDIEGVVTAYDQGGNTVVLKAGDEVPDGVEVGDHVLVGGAADEADGQGLAYTSLSLAKLREEIGLRNADRDEDDKIPADGNKAALVAALEADDEDQ